MKKILLILCLLSVSLFANIGKITSLKGEVYIQRDTKQINAKIGSILELKDKLITKDQSKALLLFNDKTSITIGKNSTLDIESFVFDLQQPTKNEATFKFGKGLFRTITGLIGKVNKDKFKIKARSASIGIRGTVFDVAVSDDATKVGVVEGGVYYVNTTTMISFDIKQGEKLVYNDTTGSISVATGSLDETKEMEKDSKELKQEEEKVVQKENKNEQNTNDDQQTTDNTPTPNPDGFEDVDVEQLDQGIPLLNTEINPTFKNETIIENINAIMNNIDNIVNGVTDDTNEGTGVTNEGTTVNTTEENTEVKNTVPADKTYENPTVGIPNLSDHIAQITGDLLPQDNLDNLDYGFIVPTGDTNINNAVNTYISGTITPDAVIQNYISQGVQATYTGAISALIGGATSSGTINLNVDFGTASVTGNVNITQENWAATINSGTVNPTGFNSADITGTSNLGTITSGAMNGKFYGTSAQNVGGTINLNTATSSANGVFGASGTVTNP